MKLLTHNFLSSKFMKGVSTGYPLKLAAEKVEVVEQDYNGDFIKRMLSRLEWPAFKQTADSIGIGADLPPELDATVEPSEDLLKKVHHALLEVEVIEGHLLCPETGRKFPIKNGIPNMLVNEDELP